MREEFVKTMIFVAVLFLASWPFSGSLAQEGCSPVPGGTLDPCSIPKYVTPLVIPPVMNNNGEAGKYDIAVRQFKQQILPGGIWNTVNGRKDKFKATKLWSYGPAADKTPKVAPVPAATSQFNYPAFTIETNSNVPIDVRWINDLVDNEGEFLTHLLPVDQTVHWANPPQECKSGLQETDCAGTNPNNYKGPVPIVTHVHGAHVAPDSDGYPEAWWLPAATNIDGFATSGRLFDDATGLNPGNLGYADYTYSNDQPATTLWYHDHSLGITRVNVYAGPAGFYLVRGGVYDGGTDFSTGSDAVLPGPAPVAGEDPNFIPAHRKKIREIPIAIQDRSFNKNGNLFYPEHRAFFEGVDKKDLKIDFAPVSDVLPSWQPETFFNVMVVNGVSWPELEVASDRYRFRLLNGSNSRFLNLALRVVNSDGSLGAEIPFYQIGAEQGFLRNVVQVLTGYATELPGDGTFPALTPAPDSDQALLIGLAERADVIVDFSGLPNGTRVRMTNTAPDSPFGGDYTVPADAGTTGQVMEFLVNSDLDGNGSTDGTTTAPEDLVLNAEPPLEVATMVREVSLNEMESEIVCVLADAMGEFIVPIKQVKCTNPDSVPFGPTEALLGTVDGFGSSAMGNPLKWTHKTAPSIHIPVILNNGKEVSVPVTENPVLDSVEEWDIYNFTEDAHPIHLHLVRFEVVSRTEFNEDTAPPGLDEVLPWEKGFKDTVTAYPGQITKIKAKFDKVGLYVWHCHIVEHEDNEMMRPFIVSASD
jgi:FtsP/CotA-like multicopper oxidase with cupredoxin domain